MKASNFDEKFSENIDLFFVPNGDLLKLTLTFEGESTWSWFLKVS